MSEAAVIMAEEKLCVGVIAGAHGVRGDLRVKSFTDDPRDLVSYGVLTDASGVREFRLRIVGTAGKLLRVHIDGVDDRNAAEAVAGLELYVDRGRLPEPEEDEFYHSDLIGLAVELEDGTVWGTVRALYDFGAGDMVEVKLASGGSIVLPFTKEVAPIVDVAGGRIVVRPPEEIEARPEAGGEGDEA